MSLIKSPGKSNPKESAGTECKTDAKVVAKEVAEGGAGDKARKCNITGSNGSDCDYAI